MQPDASKSASPLASPEAWDLVADAYTTELLPIFERFSRDALKLAALPTSARVLDAAAGPGTLALLAAACGARVSAIDFSPAMIAQLRRRAAAAGLSGIDARLGDGQVLPFEDTSFDAAFSMFGLMFFPDRAAGFRELRRVLRPQGRAVASSWAPFEGMFALVMESIRAMLPSLPFGHGAAPLCDPKRFAQEMVEADLRDVVIHPVAYAETVQSVSEFWASLQRTMAPVVLLRRKLGEQRWTTVARGVLDRLRSEAGDGPVDVRSTAYVGVGVK